MTNPNSVAPNFRDRARALRLVHAMLSDDLDLVKHITAEVETDVDIVHLILAMGDELEEILHEIASLAHTKGISGAQLKRKIDTAEADYERLGYDIENFRRGLKFRAASEMTPSGQPPLEPAPLSVKTKGGVPRYKAPSIADATTDQWYAAWEAAQRRQNYRFEIQPTVTTKGYSNGGGEGVRTKAALSSGSFGGLPPVIEPGLTQQLPFEPNYLFDSFIQMQMGAPTVEYLVHSGNTQPAAVVGELGTKPDIGVQVTPKTASATKLAGLVSTSWELYNDFPTMASFLPLELGRAVRHTTTDWIINTAGTGLIWRTDTLTRLVGADILDAIEKARDDIRVGPMFATADTIVLHPNTLGYLKRQKTTLGSYVLSGDPKTGLVDTIWDLEIIESTKLPMNYAIVFDSKVAIIGFTRQALTVDMSWYGDTAFSTNQIIWRAEHRLAVAYQKPKAINIVTGFPGAGS